MRNDSIKGSSVLKWFVYILRCADGSLYTGITEDVKRRCEQHNNGTASRYTRSRLPTKLVWQEAHPSCSSALKREAAIKAMTRREKVALIRWVQSRHSLTKNLYSPMIFAWNHHFWVKWGEVIKFWNHKKPFFLKIPGNGAIAPVCRNCQPRRCMFSRDLSPLCLHARARLLNSVGRFDIVSISDWPRRRSASD
jgi:predicted GIY-YIG superfamily endonuclease